MGRAVPFPVKTPSTLPPGPTTGPPTFPGRSSASSRNWLSVVVLTTAGVAGGRFSIRGFDSRTTGSLRSRTAGFPKGIGRPCAVARTCAIPRAESMPTSRTVCILPLLSTSRRLSPPPTRLAAVRKSPCGSIRNAVPKVWLLTIVTTPSRARSSSSGRSTEAGGAVGVGVGSGVALGGSAIRRWAAVGIRTAAPVSTRLMTRAARSCSSRPLGRRLTVLKRGWPGFLGVALLSYTFITMRLRNTETNAVQPLEPAGRPIGIYVCGITPYDTTHLGHAFTYVVFDVLVRALRAAGHAVRYVQNVTDVDDDIIRRARELGTTWDRLAAKETALYEADMADLNVRAPDVFPKVSQTIPKIVALVRTLEAQGHAYQRGGNVYFRVGSVTDYGRLSRLGRDEMIKLSAERGADPNDSRKQDPLDFLLWQESAPDEPHWSSPWGEGRPGWHIECSAMALANLGDQVDVHGGGSDLIFPHHESEIAQSESVTGIRPFARIWAHVGMLRYRGQMMSKSLHNLVLVRDLLGRYDPDSIRVLLLRHHYRESWDYTPEQLDDAAAWTGRLRESAGRAATATAARAAAVFAALDDDLDTPRALRLLEESIQSGAGDWRAAADVLGLRLGDDRMAASETKKALGWRAPFS